MAGGAGRRDAGPVAMSGTNVFAALGSLRRKKKSEKGHAVAAAKGPKKETEPPVFWAPAPLSGKSWADVGDEDDDEFYATTALPQPMWSSAEAPRKEESASPIEHGEGEDDLLDGDDDIEEESDHDTVAPVPTDPVPKKPSASLVSKEPEKQLSKKELKKKELAELEAVLAEFGIPKIEATDKESLHEVKKLEEPSALPSTENKTAKKKKAKKEKSSKEVKGPQDQVNRTADYTVDESTREERAEDDNTTIDVKERLKKMASMKKKKSSKEMDAAAKAAAVEAAARSAKLLAAKKKEKKHYNQQPVP